MAVCWLSVCSLAAAQPRVLEAQRKKNAEKSAAERHASFMLVRYDLMLCVPAALALYSLPCLCFVWRL